jgi:hypothetical protein
MYRQGGRQAGRNKGQQALRGKKKSFPRKDHEKLRE